jgi:serine/threonine protein kinase HipA of HipAB toxin-antitoxin module
MPAFVDNIVFSPTNGEYVMRTVQISARVDEALKNAIEKYCQSRGIVMNHFIQEALLDRLEELEDIEELKKIRHEPTRPLAEVLRELKLDGKL